MEQPFKALPAPLMRAASDTVSAIFAFRLWRNVVFQVFLVCAVPVFVFFYHDPDRHFLWATDWDIRIVYEALLVNSGLKNFEPAHTGYGSFFLIAKWFQFLEALGVIKATTIAAIPQAPQSDAVLQSLTYWTRVLTMLLASVMTVSVMFITRALTGSALYGVLAALVFVGSKSINTHVVLIRSELFSAAFVYLAVLLSLWAVRDGQTAARTLALIGVAAFCALFSLYAKTASIPLILLIPLFAVLFARFDENGAATARTGTGLAVILMVAAAAAAWLWMGPFVSSMTAGAYGYNGLIMAYTVGCIVIYARLNGLGGWDVLACLAAIVLGLAVAQGVLLGADPHQESQYIANHIGYLAGQASEGLLGVAPKERTELGGVIGNIALIGKIALQILKNLKVVALDSFLNFCWVCRRFSIVYLLALILLVVVLWRRDNVTRFRAAFLMLSLVFVEAVLRFHTFNDFYRMFVEGLLVVTTAYYIQILTFHSSIEVKNIIAVLALIFSAWFSVDDVQRKMLWPTFAPHNGGSPLPHLDRMPDLADRFTIYEREYKEYQDARRENSNINPVSVWWWEDNRNFLWSEKPWKVWNE